MNKKIVIGIAATVDENIPVHKDKISKKYYLNKEFKKFVKGSFSETAKNKPKVPLLSDHKDELLLGEAYIEEKVNGDLWVEAHLDLNIEISKKILNIIEKDYKNEKKYGFSIQGFPHKRKESVEEKNVCMVYEYEIREISIVLPPNNPKAKIIKIK